MPRKSHGCLLVGLSAVVIISAPAHAQNIDPAGGASGVTQSPGDAAAPSSITPAPAAIPETAPPAYDSRGEADSPPSPPSPPAFSGPARPVPRVPSRQVGDGEGPGAKSYQPPPSPISTESYGAEIVGCDLAGLVVTWALATKAQGWAALSYFAASPVVHSVHGNFGRALGGLLLHVASPAAGVLVGLAMERSICSSSDEDYCGLAVVGMGFMGGMIAATAIDAAVLARKVPVHSSSSPASSQASLTPTFSLARAGGGALAGIAGRF